MKKSISHHYYSLYTTWKSPHQGARLQKTQKNEQMQRKTEEEATTRQTSDV
jgi:hypothetical protein